MSPAAEYYSGVFFQVHLLGLPVAPGQQGAGSAGGPSSGSAPLGLLHGVTTAHQPPRATGKRDPHRGGCVAR